MNKINELLKLIEDLVNSLKEIKSIKAIVLGGSWATGRERQDSNIDLGIFYNPDNLLDINDIKKIITKFNDTINPRITPLGNWGKWLNGGASLTINNKKIDLLYRDINFVQDVINETQKGIIQVDYYQQPAFGFFSHIYCAEVFESKILYDPDETLLNLKEKVKNYPPELKKSIINKFLWDSEYALFNAYKFAKNNNNFSLAGCLTRITSDLIQVIYALNETYFINEKNILSDIEIFKIKPHAFSTKLVQLITNISPNNNSENLILNNAHDLIKQVVLLTPDYYKPPFSLKYA